MAAQSPNFTLVLEIAFVHPNLSHRQDIVITLAGMT